MPAAKTIRRCPLGHEYTKSSDCNSCPVCERNNQPKAGFLAALAAPARRALQAHGLTTAQALANVSEAEVLALHGVGKTTLPVLRKALKEAGLNFKQRPMKKGTKVPLTVDAYIANFPAKTQKYLNNMRRLILKNAAGAEELISYQMPAYKFNKKVLVYFAGYDHHIGFYATPTAHAAFKKELSAYKTGKGSIQFPLDAPLPDKLIEALVKFRVAQNSDNGLPKKVSEKKRITKTKLHE